MTNTKGRLAGKVALITGASNGMGFTMAETSNEMWNSVVGIDLLGPFYTSRAAVKSMLTTGGGTILNILSYAQYNGNHGASYCAAKHGFQRTLDGIGTVPIPYGTTQEIADVALFLCSDESAKINGAIIPVDGGMSAM